MPARFALKAFLANAALALASLALSFVVAEAGYRIYLYKTISDQLIQLVKVGLQPSGLTQFDPEAGYNYAPNVSFADLLYFKDQFQINQYGLMANDLDPAPYSIEKPQNEYRIALLGDSFTNGLQNYIRWADLLLDYLNRSAQWRERVGESTRACSTSAWMGPALCNGPRSIMPTPASSSPIWSLPVSSPTTFIAGSFIAGGHSSSTSPTVAASSNRKYWTHCLGMSCVRR